MPPSAAYTRQGSSGPVRHGLATVISSGRLGIRGQELGVGVRHPDQRSHPSLGPMDLPGPLACVGRGPRSYRCEGGPVRRMGDE
jgi:hypothetical protein